MSNVYEHYGFHGYLEGHEYNKRRKDYCLSQRYCIGGNYLSWGLWAAAIQDGESYCRWEPTTAVLLADDMSLPPYSALLCGIKIRQDWM